jgi:hypothetical protein
MDIAAPGNDLWHDRGDARVDIRTKVLGDERWKGKERQRERQKFRPHMDVNHKSPRLRLLRAFFARFVFQSTREAAAV